MKKIIPILILAFALFIPNCRAEEKIDLYLFYGDGCPHCAAEKEFLDGIKSKYSNLEIHLYETWNSTENNKLLTRVKNALGVQNAYVPFTVINGKGYTGYSENTAYQIEKQIENYDFSKEDIVLKVIADPTSYDVLHKKEESTSPKVEENRDEEKKEERKEADTTVVLPFIGKIDAKNFSIPIMATVIGLVDGFNPCAMWVLLFLISMLIGMKNRKRMWTLGLTFLISSAICYLLFMLSWLHVAKMVSSISLVQKVIAIVALMAGTINLIRYFKKEEDACDVVDDKKRKKIFTRIKKFTKEKNLILALLGIILLAFSVNLVELACSAGLPLLFTQILAMNPLTTFEYGFYIFMYIFFFLLDDIIVFSIAMFSLKVTGFSTKYSKYSHLIGGIIMLIIGILLIFKPEILMFNF